MDYKSLQAELITILLSKGFSTKAIPWIMDNIERPFHNGKSFDLEGMRAYYTMLKDYSKNTINQLYGVKLHPGKRG